MDPESAKTLMLLEGIKNTLKMINIKLHNGRKIYYVGTGTAHEVLFANGETSIITFVDGGCVCLSEYEGKIISNIFNNGKNNPTRFSHYDIDHFRNTLREYSMTQMEWS